MEIEEVRAIELCESSYDRFLQRVRELDRAQSMSVSYHRIYKEFISVLRDYAEWRLPRANGEHGDAKIRVREIQDPPQRSSPSYNLSPLLRDPCEGEQFAEVQAVAKRSLEGEEENPREDLDWEPIHFLAVVAQTTFCGQQTFHLFCHVLKGRLLDFEGLFIGWCFGCDCDSCLSEQK